MERFLQLAYLIVGDFCVDILDRVRKQRAQLLSLVGDAGALRAELSRYHLHLA